MYCYLPETPHKAHMMVTNIWLQSVQTYILSLSIYSLIRYCGNFTKPNKIPFVKYHHNKYILFLRKKCYLNFLKGLPFGFHHISFHKHHGHQAKSTKYRVQEPWPKLLQQTQEQQPHKEIDHLKNTNLTN